MSMDEQIGAALRRLVSGVAPDPDAALQATLRRGRRERVRRLVAGAATGTLVVAGVAVALFSLVRLAPLGGARPTAGPTSPSLTVSPGPATEPEPSCIWWNVSRPSDLPEAPRTCGVLPASKRVEDGTAYQLRTPAGEMAWLVVGDRARVSVVLGEPLAMVTVDGIAPEDTPSVSFETARPSEVVGRLCGCERADLQRLARESLAVGAIYERWFVAGIDLHVDTVSRDGWTLAVSPPGSSGLDLTERIARATLWTVGADGFPVLSSIDPAISFPPDWAGVILQLVSNIGRADAIVTHGCAVSARDPNLGGGDVGPGFTYFEIEEINRGRAQWCSNGYVVDLVEVDREEALRLYESVLAVPSLPA